MTNRYKNNKNNKPRTQSFVSGAASSAERPCRVTLASTDASCYLTAILFDTRDRH